MSDILSSCLNHFLPALAMWITASDVVAAQQKPGGSVSITPDRAVFFRTEQIEWTAECIDRTGAGGSPANFRWLIDYRRTVLTKGLAKPKKEGETSSLRLSIRLPEEGKNPTPIELSLTLQPVETTENALAQTATFQFPILALPWSVPPRPRPPAHLSPRPPGTPARRSTISAKSAGSIHTISAGQTRTSSA